MLMASQEQKPVLQLLGVNKSFASATRNTFKVLDDIDLSVRPNRIHALLGRSGCGKSTLLSIIAGLLDADSGAVRIDGLERECRGHDPEVGYVFQDDRLMPWRTASDNVCFALENRPLRRGERRGQAVAMLELVGLSGFEDAFPSQLSGGMRSRVALARALVRGPRLLLMDEPFSRLDTETRSAMHQQILDLRARLGTTVLMVTHDVEEAVVLADEITVLAPNPGRIAAEVSLHARLADTGELRDGTDPEVVETMRELKARLKETTAATD